MHTKNEKFNKDTEIIKKKQTDTPESKNTMNEIKNAIDSIYNRMKQAEKKKTTFELKDNNYEIIQRRTNLEDQKRVKKTYMIFGSPSKETICKLWESQKEKRGRRASKAYLKK